MKILDKILMILVAWLVDYFSHVWAIRSNIHLFYDLNKKQVDKELKKNDI